MAIDAVTKCIQQLQPKMERFQKTRLNETQTRATFIDPLLASLGWDCRDPDEVGLEHATVDGKFVDYALKLNNKPVLLIEAKTLCDQLNDVKAITQVVGYAANAGIVWCILTNGARWRVYRSVEECKAPDKLMYEVSIDPRDSEGISLSQVAQQLWRFSRESMAHGVLDEIGERTFTDGKVRKTLNGLMRNPSRKLVNLVREALSDHSLAPKQIAESLPRVWAVVGGITDPATIRAAQRGPAATDNRMQKTTPSVPHEGRRTQRVPSDSIYDEQLHTDGNPREVIELYETLDQLCLSMAPGEVSKRYPQTCINYTYDQHIFCSVVILRSGLRAYLKLKHAHLDEPPDFARDVTNSGHTGNGDLVLAITDQSQLDIAAPLIRKSFENNY